MRLNLHPDTPQERLLRQAADILKSGGVIIYPTDTIYGFGCDITNKKAVKRICQIKGIDPEKASLSCVCEDLKIIATYANHVTTPIYKLMRNALPGPYTFILEASRDIPRHFQHKKTVGIRVPDHPVAVRLANLIGGPIASISLPMDDEEPEAFTDPNQIDLRYGKLVDLFLDTGWGGMTPSTVIDCSKGEDDIVVIREGAGSLDALGLDLE
ncbi:MAG: L-threonylcarbamoyladenylate synthase [Bacteroidota bacterium]